MADSNNNINKDINEEAESQPNEYMDKAHFTKNRTKIIICMIFILTTDGMDMQLFNFVIMPFGAYFNLDDADILIQIVASSIFLGIIIGSVIASLLTKRFGRILTINCANLLYLFSRLIMSIWLYVPLFIICRILYGLALGVIIPIFMNIYGEYLPNTIRGFLLMVAWSFFGFGELITYILGLIIMPELQKDRLQTFLLVLTIFPFLNLVVCIILLIDSPKGNLLSKKRNRSTNLIEIPMINLNPDLEEKTEEKEITKSKFNNEGYSTKEIIKEMFEPDLKKTSILMILIFIFLGYNAFGIYPITSYFLDYLDEQENGKFEEKRETPARDIIVNKIWYSIADIFANIIGGIFGEFRRFGRKGGVMIFLVLGAVAVILGLFKKILFEITSPIFSGCTQIYVNIVMNYVVEIYPTKIRDTSTSLLYLVYRFTCFLCNYISLGFYNVNRYIPFIIYAIFSVLAFIFTWALPYEMAGKSMK